MVTDGFKFAPDDLAGGSGPGVQISGGGDPAPATADVGAGTPGGGITAPASQSAGAGSVSGVAGGQQAAAAAQSFRDLAAQHGFNAMGQYQDDASAMAAVVNMMRQAQQQQQLAQYGQQYLQHAAPFQQYLSQLQQMQAQRQHMQGQQQPWFKAPEFDPSWRQLLTRDAQGNIVAVPGAPPDLPQKYMAALQHQQQFLDKFAFDPLGSIKPGVEEVARQVAQQLIQQHLGGYQEQQFANGWVAQNANWLYARDAQGNQVLDPNSGRPALSEYGQQFGRYVIEADKMGIKDVARQQEYALRQVQFNYMLKQYGQQGTQPGAPAQQQGDVAKAAFLQQAAQRGAGVAPGNYGGAAAAAQPGPRSQRELAAVMAQALAQNGFGPGSKIE